MKSWMGGLGCVALLLLTGPGTNLWFLAFVALVPLLLLVRCQLANWKLPVYLSFFAYYLLSLQGLRHAHPLMIFPLLALAAYLAIYPTLFAGMLRRWLAWVAAPASGPEVAHPGVAASSGEGGYARRLAGYLPLSVVAASLWVGGEWVRNYFATGISVLMLGHSLVDMPSPTLIQIADCLGTYGVSFLLVVVNLAIADLVLSRLPVRVPGGAPGEARRWPRVCQQWQVSVPIAVLALLLAHLYGQRSLEYPTSDSRTTFLVVGRDEQTEYQQDRQRELDIFSAYARQTIAAVNRSEEPVDAVVWPESMLSGGQAWYIAAADMRVPEDMAADPSHSMTTGEMRQIIAQTQADFTRRSTDLIAAMSGGDPSRSPSIIGGCGIVRYGRTAQQFSGVIHVGPEGQVRDTYAKNHLVMFGEYIPLIKSIPVLKNYVPAGLGLDAGGEPTVFRIGSLRVLPNLCIETAVERVSVDHLRTILRRDPAALPDVIVTLTNDAWFDHTAVVAHHLRCAQMVAIGCRRPILSSANGGPTAWIDSSGRVVEKVPFDRAGEIHAVPRIDDRVSPYVRYGALPAAAMGTAWVVFLLNMLWQRRPFFRRDDR